VLHPGSARLRQGFSAGVRREDRGAAHPYAFAQTDAERARLRVTCRRARSSRFLIPFGNGFASPIGADRIEGIVRTPVWWCSGYHQEVVD